MISEGISPGDSEEEWKVVPSSSGESSGDKSSPSAVIDKPRQVTEDTPVLMAGERVSEAVELCAYICMWYIVGQL